MATTDVGVRLTVVLDKSCIPQKLLSLAHWVGWRAEQRNGKSTKVPVNPKSGQPMTRDHDSNIPRADKPVGSGLPGVRDDENEKFP